MHSPRAAFFFCSPYNMPFFFTYICFIWMESNRSSSEKKRRSREHELGGLTKHNSLPWRLRVYYYMECIAHKLILICFFFSFNIFCDIDCCMHAIEAKAGGLTYIQKYREYTKIRLFSSNNLFIIYSQL
jgi:hypothetical protein